MFNSLNNQVHVNWDEVEVILTHPYAQYKFDMTDYPQLKPYFKAYYVKKANNYSEIKQFGLDIAQGDYVLFLMPNDILYCMTSLVDLLQKCSENSNRDYFLFSVGNCLKVNSETQDIEFNNSLTSLDGKIFRRDYLISHNIAFPEDITSGEDIYFTQKVLNLNPQYSIEATTLVLQIYPTFSSIPMEEQYLNNVQIFSMINTENVVNITNSAMDKIVEMLLQIYESLYSYDNIEYRNIVKMKLKSFIMKLQQLININAIFAKCLDISNSYQKEDIVALNGGTSFYDFVVSIFVDETAAEEANE